MCLLLSHLGVVCVRGLYIRTLATTPSSLETQVSTVLKFTKENFLKLNTTKCEIIMFGKSAAKPQNRGLEVDISVKEEVKCLGYKWKGNLSSSSAIKERIYGVENWIISPESLQQLESFQGEVAKRILKLPPWYSNTAACLALDWKSLHSVCTVRKLRFLHRVMTNEESILSTEPSQQWWMMWKHSAL